MDESPGAAPAGAWNVNPNTRPTPLAEALVETMSGTPLTGATSVRCDAFGFATHCHPVVQSMPPNIVWPSDSATASANAP